MSNTLAAVLIFTATTLAPSPTTSSGTSPPPEATPPAVGEPGEPSPPTESASNDEVKKLAAYAEEAAKESAAAKDDAEAAKDDAEQAASKAEEAAKKLDAKLDELSGGKFIEYGITGGLALGIHAPIPRGTWRQESGEVTALPYVVVLPAFWSRRQETNRFCASHWTKGQREAQKAADQLALERAKEVRVELVRHIKAGTVKAKEDAESTLRTTVDDVDFKCAQEVASEKKGGCTEEALDDLIAATDIMWHSGVGPKNRCAFHKMGLWLGVPINTYKARVSGSEFGVSFDGETTEVRQRVAFGFALTVNSWFSLLIGAGYGTLDVVTTNIAGDATSRRGNIWAVTVAPAFDIDLLRAFVGNCRSGPPNLDARSSPYAATSAAVARRG